MKKHFLLYALVATLLLGALLSTPAGAFLPIPPMPPTPTIDATTDANKGIEAAMSQATSVLEQYTTYMEEISKSLQQAKDEGVVGPFLNQLKDKAKETLALHKIKTNLFWRTR